MGVTPERDTRWATTTQALLKCGTINPEGSLHRSLQRFGDRRIPMHKATTCSSMPSLGTMSSVVQLSWRSSGSTTRDLTKGERATLVREATNEEKVPSVREATKEERIAIVREAGKLHLTSFLSNDVVAAVKEDRRNERIVEKLMQEQRKRSVADLNAWKKEAQANKAAASSRARQGGALQVPPLRPRPPSPLPALARVPTHCRLHEASIQATEVADRIATLRRHRPAVAPEIDRDMQPAAATPIDPTDWNSRISQRKPSFPPGSAACNAPTVKEKRVVVQAQYHSERSTIRRQHELEALSRTVACNVGLVQRHIGDEFVRRLRSKALETTAYHTAMKRDERRAAVTRCELARAAASEARSLHRHDAKLSLEARIQHTRDSIQAHQDTIRHNKPRFELSARSFSSLIEEPSALEGQASTAELRAIRSVRIQRIRSKQLDAYAAHNLVSRASSRSAEDFGPTSLHRVLDGTDTFYDVDDTRRISHADIPDYLSHSRRRTCDINASQPELKHPWIVPGRYTGHLLPAAADDNWRRSVHPQNQYPLSMLAAARVYRRAPSA